MSAAILQVAIQLPFKLHAKRISLALRFGCAASSSTTALACEGFHSATAMEAGEAKKSAPSCTSLECQFKQKCWLSSQAKSEQEQQTTIPAALWNASAGFGLYKREQVGLTPTVF